MPYTFIATHGLAWCGWTGIRVPRKWQRKGPHLHMPRSLRASPLPTCTLVNVFEDLYQRTIDFGGHPNERSVTGNMKMMEETDRRIMLAVLQHGDGPELEMALKTVAQCGLVSLEMVEVIYAAKFKLLGISDAMLKLRRGL
jgi:hypothetical protein